MGQVFRATIIAIVCVLGLINVNGQPGHNEKAESRSVKKVKVIKDLKKEAGKKSITDIKVRDEKGAIWPAGVGPQSPTPVLDSTADFSDPGRQEIEGPSPNNPSGTILTSFNGIPYSNIVPPDPSIAVGPNHVVHMVNGTSGSLFMVTNKSGTILIPATSMDQVTGIGGFADPITIYDHLADRFVMMEMVNAAEAGSYGLAFAISETPDPTGAWDVYFMSTGANLPDYPKLAMWPDAFYITANEFTNGTTYAGTFAYAIDRNAILQGQAAPQAVRIRLGIQSKHSGACPVTLQGQPTNTNSYGIIAWLQDDIWSTWDANDADSVGLFKYNVNWANPSASFISNVASIAAAPFKSNVCTATRGRCIPQTGSAITLEALHQKIMNQPVYRAFAGFEGVVMTHTTDAGSEKAGIRWYELRKNNGNNNWTMGQQSTWSPDGTARFMSTISYNHRGDIGLAYNVSDATGTYPGIRFTGRRGCDPAGIMTVPETTIISGSSFSGNSRFGDYNHMVADPLTGNFWVTAEYMPSFQWGIRVAQFQIDNCVQVCNVPTNLFTKSLAATSATLAWTGSTGINYYEVEYKETNDVDWISGSTTTVDSFNLSNLLPGTAYTWRVRSQCDFGTSLWINGNFSTPLPDCNTPTALQTTQITFTSATLGWQGFAGADQGYIISYKLVSETQWIEITVPSAATSSYVLQQLTEGNHYHWRIRSHCAYGQSDWSAITEFNTPTPFCAIPGNLATSQITQTAAKLSWSGDVSAADFILEYMAVGSSTWTDLPVTANDNIYNMTGLLQNTTYNWRIRAVCSPALQSDWANQTFTTLAEICNPVTGLQTTLITSNSARLAWQGVPSQAYNLEYQVSGAPSWINIPTTPGITQYNLSGLTEASSYNWRVRAVCTTLQSAWTTQSFSTSMALCTPPTALATADITSGSAQLTWGAVQGATSYRVEFQRSGATSWTLLMAAGTTNTVYLSGLTASTAYNWRVSATCPQNTTAFSQASFSTTATCATPGSLVTSAITANSATITWSSVKGIIGYRVEYKTAAATSWIVMPNTTARTVNLTGLLPATAYQWRVRTICSAGTSAPSATQSFTTPGPPCPDLYEPNNSKSVLAAIPVNTNISASIGTGSDQDWFSFSNTAATPNIRITLSQLPANYTLTLFSPSGRSLVKSARSGLLDETISFNTTIIGTYMIQVIPASSSVFDASKCYLLRANIQSGTNSPEMDITGNEIMIIDTESGIQKAEKAVNVATTEKLLVYPNPAKGRLFLQYNLNKAGKSTAIITDQTGRRLKEKSLSGEAGEYIDISSLPSGIYMVQVKTENGTLIGKFMVNQ